MTMHYSLHHCPVSRLVELDRVTSLQGTARAAYFISKHLDNRLLIIRSGDFIIFVVLLYYVCTYANNKKKSKKQLDNILFNSHQKLELGYVFAIEPLVIAILVNES